MKKEIKDQVIAGVNQYIENNGLSQQDVARQTGINAAYLSMMLRGNYTLKDTEIADRYFYTLSDWAGLPFEKQYWDILPTRQFKECIAYLEHAMRHSQTITLLCDTGFGKTATLDKFQHKHPRHCIRITVNSCYSLKDILAVICEKTGVEQAWSTSLTLGNIIQRFKELKHQGHKMIVVIDEAENMKLPVLKMLKGLYDGIKGYAALALVGTDQLIHMLDKMRRRDAIGMPQLYRRIKAGVKIISNDTGGFKIFFEKYITGEQALQKLLLQLCSNYGELHDYLEPVLREADINNQPVSEQLFRQYHNLPKFTNSHA
jgi:DNA transposition AAA+ family ATPase